MTWIASAVGLALKFWSALTGWQQKRAGMVQQQAADLQATNKEDRDARVIDENVRALPDAALDDRLRGAGTDRK